MPILKRRPRKLKKLVKVASKTVMGPAFYAMEPLMAGHPQGFESNDHWSSNTLETHRVLDVA